LHELVERITEKGVTLKFKKESLVFTSDKKDSMSQLLLSMLGAVYQFERSILLERQREGIAIAKKLGKFTGRPATIDKKNILNALNQGYSISKTAELCRVSMSTVQRAKKEAA